MDYQLVRISPAGIGKKLQISYLVWGGQLNPLLGKVNGNHYSTAAPLMLKGA